ncbi:MAG: hypothetical protein RDV48_22395 [Candidatus Eremiobacteraeota bacterium]|nr:hypothetical protein [Candidatus Eremiobacteraeota bacterium]
MGLGVGSMKKSEAHSPEEVTAPFPKPREGVLDENERALLVACVMKMNKAAKDSLAE